MKIKKFTGATAHDAMIKLKKELGPDAVVLNTKTVRAKGILKYFKKPLVEITAAYEKRDLIDRNLNDQYDSRLDTINQELLELKKIVRSMPLDNMEKENKNYPLQVLEQFRKIMIDNGIEPKIASDLIEKTNKEVNLNNKDIETIEKIIKYNLIECLGNPKPITMDGEQKVVFFIGPTGVGKTTTLAKIAASLVLEDKYDIGLITADTYRIGAVDQLRIYSDILKLPLEISYNIDDMYNAFDKFKDKDIILVDTAGRSHNNEEQIEELKEILYSRETKEVYLLVSATIDSKILESLIHKYNFLDDYKLIITKIDEANDYGNILNIRYITDKELSYYTTGQTVPDDIHLVNKEEIIGKILKENNDNGSS